MKLYKTTIVIWSEEDPTAMDLESLAWHATEGQAYCSYMNALVIEDPTRDEHWDGTEFFDRNLFDDDSSDDENTGGN